MTPPDCLLQVKHLSKHFPIYNEGLLHRQIGVIKAVDDISFDLVAGETLGLVGESGSGKTTAGRTILHAIAPTAGSVRFRTSTGMQELTTLSPKEMKPLRAAMQMVFQDPYASLNPRMTVGQLIEEPLIIHRMNSKSEREDMVAKILRKVGLNPEHRQRYPHAFSGGQRQRIGIARALIMRPSLVICDEAVSALDVSVQAQIISLLQDLQQELKLTYLFIAHNLSVVRFFCSRVAVMYAGKIVEIGPTDEIFHSPKHPYTRALLSAAPSPNPDQPLHSIVSGEIVNLAKLPAGCSFQSRCRHCDHPCRSATPELQEIRSGWNVACHFPNL